MTYYYPKMSRLRTTSDALEPIVIYSQNMRAAVRQYLTTRAGQPNVPVEIHLPDMTMNELEAQIEIMPDMQNCKIISSHVEVICFGLLYDLNITGVVPENAFKGCKRVRRAVIQAQSLRTRSFVGSFTWTDAVGRNAFKDCTNLESVKFVGTRYTVIGAYAFCDCTKLSIIEFPEDQSDDVFLSIKPYAFHGCSALTKLYIASGVTAIGGAAFHGCSGLTVVQIGEPAGKRKDISRSAFPQGVRFEYVDIPLEGMCSIQYTSLNF